MTVYLNCYSRNEDFTPNYNDEHHGNVHGKTANECMAQIRDLRNNHDCAKYTPLEIVEICD